LGYRVGNFEFRILDLGLGVEEVRAAGYELRVKGALRVEGKG